MFLEHRKFIDFSMKDDWNWKKKKSSNLDTILIDSVWKR